MQQAGSAFDGVAFHCYAGTVSKQASFTSQYPNKVGLEWNRYKTHFESLLRKCSSRNVQALSAPIGGTISSKVGEFDDASSSSPTSLVPKKPPDPQPPITKTT
ncbi:hypothetical protein JVT61DRAFT_9070 [Boletus reticuloceps]|uniref:Uncharacterized protein n=1 Tax=Boletus reticuloceps TaxID=495285 RepID=A0A8I3A4Z3_9AGAM|nr:hypothetical protein JVT61DRAFT_9070 [Boletus reticuloceps]